MLFCTDEKKPTGDSTHPAGCTDNTMVPRGNFARKIGGIIKQVAVYLVVATLVSACVEVVTAHAVIRSARGRRGALVVCFPISGN